MAARACTPFGSKQEPFRFEKWRFDSQKSHILSSEETDSLCEQLQLPQLPEMTFGNNKFEMHHESGFSICFNATDALKLVDNKRDLMKVAMAKEWAESRIHPSLGRGNVGNVITQRSEYHALTMRLLQLSQCVEYDSYIVKNGS